MLLRPPRPVLAALALGLLAAPLAACGGDDDPVVTDAETTTTTTAGPATPGEPAAGAGAVIEIVDEGGFVPPSQQFVTVPRLLVTADGRVVTAGVTTAIFPGPLVPVLTQRTIGEDGVASLIDLADRAGLLADVDYSRPDDIMDAPDTVVRITVDGTTYEHRAYALGLSGDGTERDAARAALAWFVADATDAVTGGAGLGAEEPYVADAYLVRATPADPAEFHDGLAPTVVDWPADVPVRLADAADCAEVPAAALDPLVADATQLTYFAEGGTTYELAVMPRLPGRSC
jgi:hypothetical protein